MPALLEVEVTRAPGAIVTRRRLGDELKRLRDQSGLKLDDVAQALECSPSKISRLENGKGLPRWRDVRDLLDVYEVASGEVRERLLEWSRTGRQPMWWREYAAVLASGFDTYLELEWDAARICAYESHLAHGLLQTDEYARAVLETAVSRSPDHGPLVEKLLEVRQKRRVVLSADHGLMFRCVLDESALYRVVSSPAVLRAQVDRLIDVAASDMIDVRVLPFSAGPLGAFVQSFAKMEFSQGLERGVVYIERGDRPADFLYGADEIAPYEAAMGKLLAASLQETDSIPLMKEAWRRLARA